MEAPSRLLFMLVLTAYAMAIASTLCDALLVENGQRYSTSGVFVNQQWLWFHVAAMSSALIGGLLVQNLSPAGALHGAALIAGIAPLMIAFGTWYLVDEEKRPTDLPELKLAARRLLAAFRMRPLWIVALVLFLYWFSPGFNTPLYYHMTDNLHFSQGYIGILGAISSAGSICGGLVYRYYLAGLTSKRLLRLSVVLGTATTAAFVLLFNEVTAAALHFCGGVSAMIALVATLHARRRLLPQALGRLYVRSVHVNHQPRVGARGQCRRAPLSARVRQPAHAAHPRVGGVHRSRVGPYPAAAARRQAAGGRHRALIASSVAGPTVRAQSACASASAALVCREISPRSSPCPATRCGPVQAPSLPRSPSRRNWLARNIFVLLFWLDAA